jgi:hypothetical protein
MADGTIMERASLFSLKAGKSMRTLFARPLNDLFVKHGRKPTIAGPSAD